MTIENPATPKPFASRPKFGAAIDTFNGACCEQGAPQPIIYTQYANTRHKTHKNSKGGKERAGSNETKPFVYFAKGLKRKLRKIMASGGGVFKKGTNNQTDLTCPAREILVHETLNIYVYKYTTVKFLLHTLPAACRRPPPSPPSRPGSASFRALTAAAVALGAASQRPRPTCRAVAADRDNWLASSCGRSACLPREGPFSLGI